MEYKKTILIVCEGENTEPEYFSALRDILLTAKVDVNIEIRPRPKNEIKPNAFIPRKSGKVRHFQKPEIVLPISEIEDKFAAQPTRYVREAQLGLEDNTYDEVWAVFDKDGHPRHEEAFNLANTNINGKTVNIAFSSIAFEYWILLHYESNNTPFVKSMCRKEREIYYCGSHKHDEDCKGTECVCGRIVEAKYLDYLGSKKSFNFQDYHNNFADAVERAVNLKNSYLNNTLPIYELNPYTDIYKLIFKLIHLIDIDYQWFDFRNSLSVNNYDLGLSLNGKELNVKISIKTGTEILHPDSLQLIDSSGRNTNFGRRIILREQAEIFNINLENLDAIFFGFQYDNQNFITEIPFITE